jgi:hypothetical protein
MRDLLTRAAGWRSLGVAAILLVMTTAGSPAAREAARLDRFAPGAIVPASESARFRSGEWLRFSRDGRRGPLVELALDGLLQDMGGRGGLVLDREAVVEAVQSVLGAEQSLEAVRAEDLLRSVGRVRVRLEGLSLPIGSRALRRIVQYVAGDTPLDVMSVAELVDRVAGLEVTAAGAPGLLDGNTLAVMLGSALGKAQRGGRRGPDADFERRQALRLQYAAVVSAVRQARRAGAADGERLYESAYDRLVEADRIDAAPLLDLHLQLERELERTHFPSLTRAERIAARAETRRRIFESEMADMLFGRDEAMERYELDRLALAADASLSAEQKAERLGARRDALRVELAKLGTWVSFPDEARPRRLVHAAEPEDPADLAEEDEGGPRGRR